MMGKYIVMIEIDLAGEYEKRTHTLVEAANTREAEALALKAEAHNELELDKEARCWRDDWMSYRIGSVTQVTNHEWEMLKVLL